MYQNASKGLFLLFISELLAIASCALIVVFPFTIADSLVLTLLITLIPAIVGFIIALRGLFVAGKDENGYKNAFGLIVGLLIGQILVSILSSVGILASSTNTILYIFDVVAVVMIFNATRRLLKGNEKFCKYLLVTEIIYGILYIGAFVFGMFLASSVSAEYMMIMIISAIVIAVLTVVAEILVLVAYFKASKLLKN